MEGEVRWSNPVMTDKREGPMFQTGVLLKKVNGEMVDKTVHFDKEYHVSWSNVLESILGSFKDLAKRISKIKFGSNEKPVAGTRGKEIQERPSGPAGLYFALLGQDPDLVLQGGGNTSVKMNVANLFGESEEVLYVKGSGWNLATIERQGFAPVKLDLLKRMARLNT